MKNPNLPVKANPVKYYRDYHRERYGKLAKYSVRGHGKKAINPIIPVDKS